MVVAALLLYIHHTCPTLNDTSTFFSDKMNGISKRLKVPTDGGPLPDRWINNDIKPIEAGRRTWGLWTFHNYCATPFHQREAYLTLTDRRGPRQLQYLHLYDREFIDCNGLDLVAGYYLHRSGEYSCGDAGRGEFRAGGILPHWISRG